MYRATKEKGPEGNKEKTIKQKKKKSLGTEIRKKKISIKEKNVPRSRGIQCNIYIFAETDPEDIIFNRFSFFNVYFASQPWEFFSPEMSKSYSPMLWINLISAGRDSSVF